MLTAVGVEVGKEVGVGVAVGWTGVGVGAEPASHADNVRIASTASAGTSHKDRAL